MTLGIAVGDDFRKMDLPRQSTLEESISAIKAKFNIETASLQNWSFFTPSASLTVKDYGASRITGQLDVIRANPIVSLGSLYKINPSTSLVSLIVQPPGTSVVTNVYISLTFLIETSLTISVNNIVVTIKVDVSLTIYGLIKELKKTEEGSALKTCDRYYTRKPKNPIWIEDFDREKSGLETEVLTDNRRLSNLFQLFPHEDFVSLLIETEGSGEQFDFLFDGQQIERLIILNYIL